MSIDLMRDKPTVGVPIGQGTNGSGAQLHPVNPAYNTYVGARYVPIFAGEWDATKTYEPLTIVMWQGNSYTSKTFVPAHTEIGNEDFWALTGNYNAQVEVYRQEVQNAVELSKTVKSAQVKNLFPAYLGCFDKDSTGQGCFGVGEKLYIYHTNGNVNGSFTILDTKTGSITFDETVYPLLHGNDFTVTPSSILCAPYKNANGTVYKLLSFNIGNTSVTQINLPPVPGYPALLGVAYKNENEWLLLLNDGGKGLENCAVASYNPIAGTIKLIISNLPNVYCSVAQTIEYENDKIYITGSWSNGVLEYDYTADPVFNAFYGLPFSNPFGMYYGELEGMAKVDGFQGFIGYSIIAGTNAVFNLSSNFSELAGLPLPYLIDLRKNSITVNTNSNTFYETGSAAKPFKKLERAVLASSVNAVINPANVIIRFDSDVPNSTIYNSRLNLSAGKQNTISGQLNFINCDVMVEDGLNIQNLKAGSSKITTTGTTFNTIDLDKTILFTYVNNSPVIKANMSQLFLGFSSSSNITGSVKNNTLIKANSPKPAGLTVDGTSFYIYNS